MKFYVYMLLSNKGNKYFSYVGYTVNLKKRLSLHNSSKGAKFTRGKKWKIIYSRGYPNKSLALKAEYLLKKNYIMRKLLKKKYLFFKNLIDDKK